MIASASSEFIALCQSQVLLLTQALGATSTVVYLAKPAVNLADPTLVPLVAYPDTSDTWAGLNDVLSTMVDTLPETPEQSPHDPSGSSTSGSLTVASWADPEVDTPAVDLASGPGRWRRWPWADIASSPATLPPAEPPKEEATVVPPPLVLPLAHDGIVLGVLVSTRETSPWNPDEHHQAEQVANTLALACIMDRRGQWLQQQLQQRQLSQSDQSETFHDLLHQFRNPLTALQTFGKLLVKRMQTDDPNQPIAEGIVRESRRLQDLAQYFDNAVTEGDEVLQTAPVNPPLAGLLPPAAEVGATTSPPLIDDPGQSLGHGLGHTLQVVSGSIGPVVIPLLRSTTALAQDREMYLEQDIPADLPEVWLDSAALGEVISNLLDNALKYAPAHALIWVTGGLIQQVGGQFFQGIAVGDSGGGIPLIDQPHIFDRHYRGIQTTGDIAGTGLGLAIVQELVQGMGGHIDLISPVQVDQWVTTPPERFTRGPGTLFIVWLRTV